MILLTYYWYDSPEKYTKYLWGYPIWNIMIPNPESGLYTGNRDKLSISSIYNTNCVSFNSLTPTLIWTTRKISRKFGLRPNIKTLVNPRHMWTTKQPYCAPSGVPILTKLSPNYLSMFLQISPENHIMEPSTRWSKTSMLMQKPSWKQSVEDTVDTSDSAQFWPYTKPCTHHQTLLQ